mgnify:FL=1
MPKIPPIGFRDPKQKGSYDFCEGVYLAMSHFMPSESVKALEDHYKVNIKAVESLKRMSPKHYDKLIADFKQRKAEILLEPKGP